MTIRHRLKKIADRSLFRSDCARLLDLARDPFLPARHQVEAVANRIQRRDLVSEWPNLSRNSSAPFADQRFEALRVARFLIALAHQKVAQLLLLDFRRKTLQRGYAGTLGFEQQVEHLLQRLVHEGESIAPSG